MKKDPRIFLTHIFESIEAIEKYTKDFSKERFLKSSEIQDAVMRRFEIIGEAAKNIPDDFEELHPGVFWYQMKGMRNKLIHEYFAIDLDLIWDTVQKDLPQLKKQIEQILNG